MTPVLQLTIKRSTILAEAVHGRKVVWAGTTEYATWADLADAIGRLAAELPRNCKRVSVRLGQPPAQVRRLVGLPPVKEQDLEAVVEQQAKRFFRRNGKPLVTDAIWLDKKRSEAIGAAVEEPVADAVIAGVRAAGLLLEGIGVAGVEAPLLLLPGVERAARFRRRQRRRRAAIVVTVALWLGTLAGFAIRLALERAAVTRELNALTPILNTTRDARRSLEQAARAITAISTARADHGGSLVALQAVTAALPDSALLTSFAWRTDGPGVLSGVAKHASDVLGRIERAGVGVSPRFEGPIVREVQGGRNWERFTIAWDVSCVDQNRCGNSARH